MLSTASATPGGAAEIFAAAVQQLLARILESQRTELDQAAARMADTVQRGGLLYAFGSGHSQSVAHEFYYRAGGLACCDVIHDPGFGRAERLSGYAATLLENYPLRAEDLLIVISNSGRNALPVEMAQLARARGLGVIAITSLAHSRAVELRVPGGARLFEVCDVALDNGCPSGDALVELPGGLRVGAPSTLAGAFLAQTLVSLTVEELARRGVTPPVLLSMNLDEGDARNRTLLELYRGRLRGL